MRGIVPRIVPTEGETPSEKYFYFRGDFAGVSIWRLLVFAPPHNLALMEVTNRSALLMPGKDVGQLETTSVHPLRGRDKDGLGLYCPSTMGSREQRSVP